jgi:hypothetical protein
MCVRTHTHTHFLILTSCESLGTKIPTNNTHIYDPDRLGYVKGFRLFTQMVNSANVQDEP